MCVLCMLSAKMLWPGQAAGVDGRGRGEREEEADQRAVGQAIQQDRAVRNCCGCGCACGGVRTDGPPGLKPFGFRAVSQLDRATLKTAPEGDRGGDRRADALVVRLAPHRPIARASAAIEVRPTRTNVTAKALGAEGGKLGRMEAAMPFHE